MKKRDAQHAKRDQLVERNEDGTLTKETVKRAMKAFRKRLKVTRLDEESRIGGNPLTKGEESTIIGVVPPPHYPAEIWDELVELGRLRKASGGVYELMD